MGMILTDEQQAILDGAKGETMAKVMKTLVMFEHIKICKIRHPPE